MRALAFILALTAAVPATAQQAGPDCTRIYLQKGADISPQAAAAALGEPGGAPIYYLSRVDQLPRIANAPEFQRFLARNYPPPLRDAGVGGVVQACFIVEADGSVSYPGITSSTDPQFNLPTLGAVRMMRFRPARVGGRPVRVWVEQPIHWMVQRDTRERTADRRITHPETDWRPTLADRIYGKNYPYPPSPAPADPPLPGPPPVS